MIKNTLLRIFWISLFLVIIIYTILSYLGCIIFYIDSNQILYLFSTSAQVIAGLFGLSMTGYIFLKDTLDRALKEDETLIDIIPTLKSNYYQTIITMSIGAVVSILLCIFCISDIKVYGYINNWILNVSLIIVIHEVTLIICFACSIIEPDKIEKISKKLKNKIESRAENIIQGDFKQFMKDFNEIELFLREYLELPNHKANDKYRYNRISNAKIAELLYKNELINKELFEDLLSVIKYRNYVVHSTEVTVEQIMCDKVKNVKARLKDIFGF